MATRVCAGEERRIGLTPEWVAEMAFEIPETTPGDKIHDGIYYLLFDHQVRVREKTVEHYYHVAKKIINQKGATTAGRVSMSFDPSFQTLVIHQIRVHRGEAAFDQLSADKIKILQRERNLEYQIYDGSKSAMVILEDVRIGDVVEYRFTVKGSNPVFGGRFFSDFDLQWRSPLYRLHHRLLWPKERKLYLENHKTEWTPTTREQGEYIEYTWLLNQLSGMTEDDEAPNWFDPYPWVQASEMENWGEVSRWALPYYSPPGALSPELTDLIRKIAGSHETPRARLLAALRFVQREVRYMGIEVGPGSHAPSHPSVVLKRRFGDCKDKTLLAVTMMRALGIDASPALVHTRRRHTIADLQPSPHAFNHVIVYAVLSGDVYWLDPTREFQEGGLQTICQSDYGAALVVRGDARDLTPMTPVKPRGATKTIQETFDLRAGDRKPGRYTVKTTWCGCAADRMRGRLAEESREEIQKDYLNFYVKHYPTIESAGEMEFLSDDEENRITIIEHYAIPKIWKRFKSGRRKSFDLYTFEMYEYIDHPTTSRRTMPLHIRFPLHFKQETKVLAAEEWEIEPGSNQVKDAAFSFSSRVAYADRVLTLSYEFNTLRDHLEPGEVKKYIKNLDLVDNLLDYRIYTPGARPETSPPAPARFQPLEFNHTLLLAGGIIMALVALLLHQYRYTPPYRYELASGARYFPVSLQKFTIMTIFTLGLYKIYWFYKNWKYIRERDNSRIHPLARAIFAPFWCYSLLKDINGHSGNGRMPAALLALLYFVIAACWKLPDAYGLLPFFSFLVLLPAVFKIAELNYF
ncbi:MAG: DUF3857 and transglutaminase domain-containing protein, partial [Desulfobacterales bacterium]|nr:DUF3857 and transglutaminase domain-containing protein [Desulfobacterales bacterium]